MAWVTFDRRVVLPGSGDVFLTGVTDLTFVTGSSGPVLYVTSGPGGGVASYRIQGNQLVRIDTFSLPGQQAAGSRAASPRDAWRLWRGPCHRGRRDRVLGLAVRQYGRSAGPGRSGDRTARNTAGGRDGQGRGQRLSLRPAAWCQRDVGLAGDVAGNAGARADAAPVGAVLGRACPDRCGKHRPGGRALSSGHLARGGRAAQLPDRPGWRACRGRPDLVCHRDRHQSAQYRHRLQHGRAGLGGGGGFGIGLAERGRDPGRRPARGHRPYPRRPRHTVSGRHRARQHHDRRPGLCGGGRIG
jgi:hypothetical protein